MNSPLTYKDSGVDIDAGDQLVERIKPLARATATPGVLQSLGGFGAMFELPSGYQKPVLVSGTDGVGTKLLVAQALNRHDTIGIDLVAMSVNDILVQGADPLYFLDYFACSRLNVDVAEQVVSGIARGCELSGCALIGGETAEMPDMYQQDDYDLAGFAVGIVEKDKIIDGQTIAAGDQLIGIESSGAHSNGYSLIRRVIEREFGSLDASKLNFSLDDGQQFADALMAPTRLYVKSVRAALEQHAVKGLVHITGGGLLENLPRVLPDGLAVSIDATSWEQPALFKWLASHGQIEPQEMARVFNCGIGMVLIVDADHVEPVLATLRSHQERAVHIGQVTLRQTDSPVVTI